MLPWPPQALFHPGCPVVTAVSNTHRQIPGPKRTVLPRRGALRAFCALAILFVAILFVVLSDLNPNSRSLPANSGRVAFAQIFQYPKLFDWVCKLAAESALQASKVLWTAQDRCRPLGPRVTKAAPTAATASFRSRVFKQSEAVSVDPRVWWQKLILFKTTGATYLPSSPQDSHPPSATPSRGGSSF
ncbi:hypothetical protein NN561_010413 [Cricetulus griseus]